MFAAERETLLYESRSCDEKFYNDVGVGEKCGCVFAD